MSGGAHGQRGRRTRIRRSTPTPGDGTTPRRPPGRDRVCVGSLRIRRPKGRRGRSRLKLRAKKSDCDKDSANATLTVSINLSQCHPSSPSPPPGRRGRGHLLHPIGAVVGILGPLSPEEHRDGVLHGGAPPPPAGGRAAITPEDPDSTKREGGEGGVGAIGRKHSPPPRGGGVVEIRRPEFLVKKRVEMTGAGSGGTTSPPHRFRSITSPLTQTTHNALVLGVVTCHKRGTCAKGGPCLSRGSNSDPWPGQSKRSAKTFPLETLPSFQQKKISEQERGLSSIVLIVRIPRLLHRPSPSPPIPGVGGHSHLPFVAEQAPIVPSPPENI